VSCTAAAAVHITAGYEYDKFEYDKFEYDKFE
jgi:hypothetical protein